MNGSPRDASKPFTVATADGADDVRLAVLSRLLARIRAAFGMDVVFVSRFENGRRVFTHVDALPLARDLIKAGSSDPLEDSYCQRIVDGRLPQAIPDAQALPEAAQLAATAAVGVGAHLSVPIRLRDGQIFGTLCCFSRAPHPGLGEPDAAALRQLAEFVARTIDSGRRRRGFP
jgi:GAF domain-containing protein